MCSAGARPKIYFFWLISFRYCLNFALVCSELWDSIVLFLSDKSAFFLHLVTEYVGTGSLGWSRYSLDLQQPLRDLLDLFLDLARSLLDPSPNLEWSLMYLPPDLERLLDLKRSLDLDLDGDLETDGILDLLT